MIKDLYSPKQVEVLKRAWSNEDWFLLINHGAKRSGKTVVDNDLFISELLRVKAIAKKMKVDNPLYILAGADLGSIYKNVLIELINKYGLNIKYDKFNNFKLFGVTIVQVGHSTIGGLSKARGFTSFGAYINEASLANKEVFDEIKARCSGIGARIIADTNPGNPEHWLLKDYINNEDNLSFHWKLDDNTFLDKRYIDNIKKTTPKGVFYDRGISGLWTVGEGVIYENFNKETMSVKSLDKFRIERMFVGADFGFEHTGVFCVIAKSYNGEYIVIREYAAKHKGIAWWCNVGLKIKKEFGDIPFYCDSARPDNISAMVDVGLNAMNANKNIDAGIEAIATLMQNDKFFIFYDECEQFKKEIYAYQYNGNTGKPLKENDDCMDAIRYGIKTDMMIGDTDDTYQQLLTMRI